MSKTLSILAASGLVLGAAACAPSHAPGARASLDCPASQGDLTRASVAADGRSCVYKTADGDDVLLRLLPTGGNPEKTLASVETELMAPIAQARAAAPAPADKITPEASAQAAQAAADAKRDTAAVRADDDDVEVHGPGVHVQAHGDVARVNLPGIHIVADDAKDQANIRIGGMSIVAQDDAATIRNVRPVRLKGEAFSREKRGVRATFIYTGKDLPEGYHVVGYEAGGPKAGPLAIATVRTREGGDSHDLYEDLAKLVRRNGGV